MQLHTFCKRNIFKIVEYPTMNEQMKLRGMTNAIIRGDANLR